ncbi:MAG TPA: hypothetical protein PKV84_06085 [Candidatus Omnitrophota bacterium]|nr:hypothetical protein [Candidatus Omnitrophota bacterium]
MRRALSFLKLLFSLSALVALLLFISLNFFLYGIAQSEDFKRFAEQKVGEYLKAKVHIGEIRPYHFTKLALEKILIETPSSKGGSQLVRVERLLFQYHIRQLWERKWDVPAGVVLKNPAILIEPDEFPYRYFENSSGGLPGFFVPSLDFTGGEIRYLLPSLGKEILLHNVDGKIQPVADKKVEVDIRARASGLMEGRVRIRGTVDPSGKTHDLWLELEGMDFAQDIPLPLKALTGKVRWADRDLFFEELTGTLYGWSAELSGAFLNQDRQPKIECHLEVGKTAIAFKLDVFLDLSRQDLSGSVKVFEGAAYQFNGKARQEKKRFIVETLTVDSGYQGRGELDFATGNYEWLLEKNARRMAIHSNLRGLDFVLNFNFDHVKFWGLDLVTKGKLFLHAASLRWKGRDILFKGDFETDYFILDQQPFEDFKGSFDLSPAGITGFRSSWGERLRMTGQVTLRDKKPKAKFTVHVPDLDLGRIQEFMAKPLPKALGGHMEGKLNVEGDFQNPEISAVFNIRDGKWGQLDYDRGIIQLRGFLPYLPLKDSKIWKGRTVFFLTGALDLKLDNIFAGVKIQTPDKFVIWKGIEASLHKEKGGLEMNRAKLGDWGEFSVLEAGSPKASHDEGDPAARDDEEESALKLGPKLRF